MPFLQNLREFIIPEQLTFSNLDGSYTKKILFHHYRYDCALSKERSHFSQFDL